ncbi:exported hypothetical protein [Sphingobacterium sp. PM2-P1-29]|nr:exported hypothetical protein [Sphingobacterium sp. PM2-P1-29]
MKRYFQLFTLLMCFTIPVQAQLSLKKIMKSGEKAVRNVGRTVEKGVRDMNKTTGVAIHDLGKATGKAADDARKAIEKGLLDASRESGRAGKNVVEETGRVGSNTVDIFKAIEKYTTTTITGTLDLAKSTEQRIREGKFLDAVFHAALDPLTTTEEAAFMATQQSKYLNTAAATAASVYGGPAGSAAYAAWQTYKISGGNAELAFRSGIISGLTSTALKEVGGMSGAEIKDMVQKSVLAGTVGGLAIAASGGSEEDIKNGFILGGGMVLVQDLYQNYVGHPLDASSATKDPYCISFDDPSCNTLKAAYYTDENGNQVFDASKLDRNASHVGMGTKFDVNGDPIILKKGIDWYSASDQSTLMRTAAKVPGMNAMGLFHDKFVVSWGIGENIGNQLTIYPAMLFTYLGTDGGITNKIAEQTGQPDQNQQRKPAVQSEQQALPTNAELTLLDNRGNEYHVRNNVTYDRWGRVVEVDKMPNEIKDQLRNVQAQVSIKDVMFDFSSPGTNLNESTENIPCGFNGNPDKFRALPAIEYAIRYLDNKNWEEYGMKNMLTTKHINAPIGSIIYVRNVENGALARTYVIGGLSEMEMNSGATIILSDPVLKQLGATGNTLWVETDYEDIGVEKLVFQLGNVEKLAFDNLRNGKWRLRVYDDFRTIHTIEDYQNQLQVNLPKGQYGFEIVDTSPLQTHRAYTGTLVVN